MDEPEPNYRKMWLTCGVVAAIVVALMAAGALFVSAIVGDWSGQHAERSVNFERDRNELDEIAALARASRSNSNYRTELPPHLAVFSATGSASIHGDMVFVPQWTGIPDDAGGYIHSRSGSPEGMDMYGMRCRDPVPLAGGWWTCGMAVSE